MKPPPIVAICLVKNEDKWFAQVLANISAFVDKIVVIDTGSTDGTVEIAKRAGAVVKRVDDLSKTHDAVETYFDWKWGWLFGVDGDELYDPEGLKTVKRHIEDGAFDNVFQVETCFFHVTNLYQGPALRGPGPMRAKGYMAPPSRAPSKLYNLSNVEAWPSDGHGTLFHAKTRVLRQGAVERDSRYQALGWHECPLRCLHMRFMKRSSRENEGIGARANPEDLIRGKKGNYRQAYQKGELETVDVTPFFISNIRKGVAP